MSSAGSHHASPWRWRSVLLLAFLIFHWYLFSYFFNANLKTWFKLHKQGNEDVIFPLLFSIFLSNTAASALWVAYASGRRGCDALSGTCLSQLVFGFKLDFTLLCASGVVGIAATVLVLEHGSIQLVQIARSVGPLFTSLWAYLVLNQPTTGLPLVCLATTLGGTILASWQEPSFCTATAILMFTVNATLTFRNAATKKIISHFHGYSPSLIASALLALTSAAGLLLVTALWFVCLMMGRSAMLPRDLTTHRQLFVLGGCNFAYNLASQIVLANVAVVSHGMLELFKRVFVLVAASVMLQDVEWQWHNILGAFIACAATAAYFYISPSHQPTVRASGPGSGAAAPLITSPRVATMRSTQLASPGNGNGCQGEELEEEGECKWHAPGPAMDKSPPASIIGRSSSGGGCKGWWQALRRASSTGWGSLLGTASQRARLANTLIIALLVVSPLEFVQGAGRSGGGAEVVGASTTSAAVARPSRSTAAVPVALLGALHVAAPAKPYVAGVHGDPWSPFLLQAAARRGTASVVACPEPGTHPSLDGRESDVVFTSAVSVANPDGKAGSQPQGRSLSKEQAGGGTAHTAHRKIVTDLGAASNTQGGGAEPAADVPGSTTGGDVTILGGGVSVASTQSEAAAGTGGRVLAQANNGGLDSTQQRQGGTSIQAGAAAGITAAGGDNDGGGGADGKAVDGGGQVQGGLRQPPPSATAILGVYTGWIGRDNLGDEIVADIFFDLLAAAVLEATPETTKVTLDRNATSLVSRYKGCDSQGGGACDFAVMGGGSTVYIDYVKRIADVIQASAPVLLFGSGRQSGLLNKRLNDKYISMLGGADLVGGVRGRLTSDYLLRLGKRRVQVVRDSALLTGALYPHGHTHLAPRLPDRIDPGSPSPASTSSTTADRAPSGSSGVRPLVVVTLPKSHKDASTNPAAAGARAGAAGAGARPEQRPRGQLAVHLHAVAQLVNKHGFQVVLQAVDADSRDTHAEQLGALNAMIEAGAPPVVAHDEFHDWAAVADLYARAAVSLNSRLHSGVLAAGSLRPPVYLSNNAKYMDFMSSIGLQAYIVDPSRPTLAGLPAPQLAAHLVQVVLDAAGNSSHISLSLRELQQTTLTQYKASLSDLLMRVEMRDGERYTSVMCCDEIRISRSPPVMYRSIVAIECLKPQA